MTIRVYGVRATLRQAEKEMDQQLEMELRASALATYADLVRTTPVDTGRARNSWTVSGDVPVIRYEGDGGDQSLYPRQAPGTIWFANGVDYIRPLNEGHSRQAPIRFIEQAIVRNIPGAQLAEID